jgi:hypothetical protein
MSEQYLSSCVWVFEFGTGQWGVKSKDLTPSYGKSAER